MKKATRWVHPLTNFVGSYPGKWAGYTFLQWSTASNNWHEGVDYNGEGGCDADKGMDLVACADGVIDWIGYHKGWGWHMFIKHDDPKEGIVYSHYAHNLKDSFTVKAGDEVSVGQKVCEVGDSGWNSMCAHVHFEIRKPIEEGYDFWADPNKGWDLDKMKQFFFDPYLFIEERKSPYTDCEALEKKISKLNSKLDSKEGMIKSLEESNRSLREALRASEDEIKAMKKGYDETVTELEEEIEELKRKASQGEPPSPPTEKKSFWDLIKIIFGGGDTE